MRLLRYWLGRAVRRVPDPDVARAMKVIDETHRTTAMVGRTLLDLDAHGWTARDRPIEADHFRERKQA